MADVTETTHSEQSVAMNASILGSCPPIAEHEGPFLSLGAIDRIGEAFCESAQDSRRIADLQRYRAFRMRCLNTTLGIVDACQVPQRAAVSVRLKRLDSIRRKIRRTSANFKLGRLDDVVGIRVICQDLRTVREFSDRLRQSPCFYRQKDYISSPAATGCRGIHNIMRLRQPVTATTSVNMRFEIQARTYLQHRWAVWSESLGEALKIGMGTDADHQRLRAISEKVAKWEEDNPATRQIDLPEYSGGRSIAVCWRVSRLSVETHFFMDRVEDAVRWLNHLETIRWTARENALLLVGVTEATETHKLIQLTHPLYSGARVLGPEYWQPRLPT